eukprot:13897876-Alexandrium_andersonii.AAC.1
MPSFVGRFGICASSCAECTPRELREPLSRPLLGPRSSRADCGLRRIGALAGLGRVADFTWDP